MADESEPRLVWQGLMDAAYERWQHHKEWDYERFLASCETPSQVYAVLLGNLNYQVENGGFRQWVDNGYAQQGDEVAQALDGLARDEGCPAAGELAKRVRRLLRHVNLSRPSRGCFHDYWRPGSGGDEDGGPGPGQDYAESLDSWYYSEAQPTLLPAVERWLAKKVAEEALADKGETP